MKATKMIPEFRGSNKPIYMGKRTYNFLFLFLLLSVIGSAVFFYLQHRASIPQENISRGMPSNGFSKRPLEVGGFHFHGVHKGKKILSIKADKFRIEKKKLGFISFGPVRVAKFKNAVVDVYGRNDPANRSAGSKPGEGNAETLQPGSGIYHDVTFKDMFLKEALPSLSMKGVFAINIGPVCLNLHDEKSLMTRITASSASIRLKQRYIIFTGNVRVTSGLKNLETKHLIFFPEQSMLKTDGQYVLKTSEDEFNGSDLSTNILLSAANRDLRNGKTIY
jgi:lipopolysaccharide-assembly LptC-related protein